MSALLVALPGHPCQPAGLRARKADEFLGWLPCYGYAASLSLPYLRAREADMLSRGCNGPGPKPDRAATAPHVFCWMITVASPQLICSFCRSTTTKCGDGRRCESDGEDEFLGWLPCYGHAASLSLPYLRERDNEGPFAHPRRRAAERAQLILVEAGAAHARGGGWGSEFGARDRPQESVLRCEARCKMRGVRGAAQ